MALFNHVQRMYRECTGTVKGPGQKGVRKLDVSSGKLYNQGIMTLANASLPQFPMRVVVRRTGLNASLLRAWERRYGAVEPGRSEGGQRLYSEADIQKLVVLKELVDEGHNISQVAGREMGQLRLLLRQNGRHSATRTHEGATPSTGEVDGGASAQEDVATRFLEVCVDAAREMDTEVLESQLNRAAMALNPSTLVDRVLVPFLNRVGLLWAEGELGPASEHVASAVIRRFLDWLLGTLSPEGNAPVALVGTPAGHRHEFGALLASVVIAGEGWRVVSLGPDLPASEIARAAARKNAGLVALSALYPREDPHLPGELRGLRRLLQARVPIVVGGPAAAPFADLLRADGIDFLADLAELRERAREELPHSKAF
jgi:MerR family transcriptional regulator, light-induced transcriptional regulator